MPELVKHPNADALSLVDIGGYTVVVRTEDWKPGALAVHVPVDALVPTDAPEFAFLFRAGRERHRVRAARLRGQFSWGLLVPARAGMVEGAEVAGELGIEKYLPPSERALLGVQDQRARTAAKRLAKVWMPVYSLDAFRKFKEVLVDGEPVVITEKIHGTNARFRFKGGRLYIGSHRVMRGATRHRAVELLNRLGLWFLDRLGIRHRAHILQGAGDVWFECAEKYGLKDKLCKYPNLVLFGEIYGDGVQDLHYDALAGERRFRVFDFYDLDAGEYVSVDECAALAGSMGLEMVPTVFRGPWEPGLTALAEGRSLLAPHLREGIVIKPATERMDRRVGRVALKLVSETYLLRKEGSES